MTRRRLSTKARAAIFAAANGICHICGTAIQATEAWDADHLVPLALGGEDSPENMRPAHAKCHRGAGSKTSDDVAKIAKAKRNEARHKGFARPKQAIKSAGFPKRERTPKPKMPPKPIYRSADI